MPLVALSGGNAVLCSPLFEIDLEIPKSGLGKEKTFKTMKFEQDGEHRAS